MRTLPWNALVLIALVPSPSLSQPGLSLSWSDCSLAPATESTAFACDDNGQTFLLVAHFVTAAGSTSFAGISGVIDVALPVSGSVPDWWALGVGECRGGALTLGDVGPISGCDNPYAGTLGQGGGLVYEPHPIGSPIPYWRRVRIDWSRFEGGTLQPNARSTAFTLRLDTSQSFDAGSGGVCAGCASPACISFTTLDVFSYGGGSEIIETTSGRSFVTWRGGQVGGPGCPAVVPARAVTWGSIKALYR